MSTRSGALRKAKKPKKKSVTSPRYQSPLFATQGGIHFFRQFAYRIQFSQTGGADALGATNFVLSSVSNYTGFTDLFDVYRVDYLEFTCTPQMMFTESAPTVTIGSPLYTAIDLDDSSTPGTLTVIREYQTCMTTGQGQSVTRRFKPGVLTVIWDGSAAVAGGHEISPWIDCAKINIPHFGLKYGCIAGAAGQTSLQTWAIDLYVGLSFKNVR